MSDLMVIGYPDEDTAQRVYGELLSLQNQYLVDLEDAAIIRRDRRGRLHVTTPAHHAVAWGSLKRAAQLTARPRRRRPAE